MTMTVISGTGVLSTSATPPDPRFPVASIADAVTPVAKAVNNLVVTGNGVLNVQVPSTTVQGTGTIALLPPGAAPVVNPEVALPIDAPPLHYYTSSQGGTLFKHDLTEKQLKKLKEPYQRLMTHIRNLVGAGAKISIDLKNSTFRAEIGDRLLEGNLDSSIPGFAELKEVFRSEKLSNTHTWADYTSKDSIAPTNGALQFEKTCESLQELGKVTVSVYREKYLTKSLQDYLKLNEASHGDDPIKKKALVKTVMHRIEMAEITHTVLKRALEETIQEWKEKLPGLPTIDQKNYAHQVIARLEKAEKALEQLDWFAICYAITHEVESNDLKARLDKSVEVQQGLVEMLKTQAKVRALGKVERLKIWAGFANAPEMTPEREAELMQEYAHQVAGLSLRSTREDNHAFGVYFGKPKAREMLENILVKANADGFVNAEERLYFSRAGHLGVPALFASLDQVVQEGLRRKLLASYALADRYLGDMHGLDLTPIDGDAGDWAVAYQIEREQRLNMEHYAPLTNGNPIVAS